MLNESEQTFVISSASEFMSLPKEFWVNFSIMQQNLRNFGLNKKNDFIRHVH